MLADIEAGKVATVIVKDYCAIIGLNPVSYTHLDVYKRQALQRLRRLMEGNDYE